MGAVHEALVAGVGVRGGHEALLHPEGVVEHLDHGHEAVGRARGVRHDVVSGRVVGAVVRADDEGGVGVARRGRDDDLPGAALKVQGRLAPRGEDPSRLDHHVDAEVAPRQVGRVAFREDPDLLAVHRYPVTGCPDPGVEAAVHRVVGKQERHCLDRAQVVDCHELDRGVLGAGRPEEVPADPAEAVHTYTHGHGLVASRGTTGPHLKNPCIASRSRGWPRAVRGGRWSHTAVLPGTPAQRSRSRCLTAGSKPRLRNRAANSSATATERCLPPVHPKAIDR